MENKREELLAKLHSLPFCMYLIDLGCEGCVEADVVTSRGISDTWSDYEYFDFYSYCLEGIPAEKIAEIKERIRNKSLYLKDLRGTQMDKIVGTEDETEELSGKFADFLELPDGVIDPLYCYRALDTELIYSAATLEKYSDILCEHYYVETTWEEMDDEVLADYAEQYKDCEREIPFTSLPEDDDEE